MKTILLSGVSLLTSFFLLAQTPEIETQIKTGNDLYKDQQYEQAARQYQKVLSMDSGNVIAKFNLANSMYRKNSRNDAVKVFEDLAAKTKETGMRSKSYYNEGVVLTKQQKLEESIESYKNSLRQDPTDKEARENLQKALLELKKRTPPKQEPKKKQQQKQQQPQMSPKEAQQRLKLMEQKEKEVQERLQKEKSKTGGNQVKDW
jgi:Ca-activated chloride channel family protein